MPNGPRRFRGLERRAVLGFTVPVATTRAARVLGLARLDREDAGEGLLIPRCKRVHTFGMRFDLDLVFLAEDDRVVELRRSVPPGRWESCPGAEAVLELPSP
jgi:uncharacterized membrane protein (UPF0127 family)